MRLFVKICFCFTATVSCLAPTINCADDKPVDGVAFQLAGGHDPLILVPVYVEEKGPFQFILDTGSFRCLLSPELSASLGIRKEAELQVTGIGGTMKISSAHVASLAVGSARRQNVEVAITDELSRFREAVQNRVDGVVGFNFLKDFRVLLDYQHNVLHLSPSSAALRDESSERSATSISFKLASSEQPLLLLLLFVNGLGPFQFVVDSGTSRTTFSFELSRKLGIVAVGDRNGTGGGGDVRILSGTVDSLAVGKTSTQNLSVGVGEFLGKLSALVGVKFDGIVGNNFLNQFEVTIDYPRGTIDLKPSVVR
jgi:predicted aspartyl protease